MTSRRPPGYQSKSRSGHSHGSSPLQSIHREKSNSPSSPLKTAKPFPTDKPMGVELMIRPDYKSPIRHQGRHPNSERPRMIESTIREPSLQGRSEERDDVSQKMADRSSLHISGGSESEYDQRFSRLISKKKNSENPHKMNIPAPRKEKVNPSHYGRDGHSRSGVIHQDQGRSGGTSRLIEKSDRRSSHETPYGSPERKKYDRNRRQMNEPSFHASDYSEIDKMIEADDSTDNHRERSNNERHRSNTRHRDDDSDGSKSVHLIDDDFRKLRDDSSEDRPEISPENLLKQKRRKLLHIKILEIQGYDPYKSVGPMNTLEEITEVEEEQMERRSLANGIEFQKNFLVGFSSTVEFLNNKYDPFDIKLDGWSDQIYHDQDKYNQVLEELYYKYGEQVSMAPEAKLLMLLGSSAMMFHFSKTLMDQGEKQVPNFDNIMKRNPDLKRLYVEAAKNEMVKQQSGAGANQPANNGNFLNNMLGNMSGNPQMGPMLNQFMSTGGNLGAGGTRQPPPQMRPAGRPTVRPTVRPVSPTMQKLQKEVEVLSPVDPDNILEASVVSAGNSPTRLTRAGRMQRMI